MKYFPTLALLQRKKPQAALAVCGFSPGPSDP